MVQGMLSKCDTEPYRQQIQVDVQTAESEPKELRKTVKVVS